MDGSFFTTRDGEWFVPTDHCRGPWDPEACHGGPPTGLIARALERLVHGQRLTRLSVDLARPVPMAGFRIETERVQSGRSATFTRAALVDDDGRERVRATALHLAVRAVGSLPTVALAPPPPPGAGRALGFPIRRNLHGLAGFSGAGVECRYPQGEDPEPGPTTIWMRTVALLPDEAMSPFQRVCPIADCGNAFGRNAEPWEIGFINPDLTITLFRDPVGEWIGSSAVGSWEPTGIGLADAMLFDELGAVGRASQSMLLTPTELSGAVPSVRP